MTICREWLLVKTTGLSATAEPLRCRSWQCQFCAPERRNRLIAEAIGGEPNTFITLTCNPAYGQSPAHRARMLVAAWRQIRAWASASYAGIDSPDLDDWRKHPSWRSKSTRPRDAIGLEHPDNGTLPFLAVFEATKRGEPHLHILARAEWLPQAWLSRQCAKLIGAPVCWIERVTNTSKAAAYVAKYCGKEPARFDTCKRYWSSQDWEVDPPEPLEDLETTTPAFEVFKGGTYEWITAKNKEGWMAWETTEGAIAMDPRGPKTQKGHSLWARAAPASRSPP